MISFPVADVRVSLWIILLVGLSVGYLAGTIGVGGFLGVPAMIYVFGVPTAVAAGTELFLAMFMGAFGAINYALEGFVDIRLVLLLYLGSLLGIFLGAYGTKVVNERIIRLVTGVIIILCVISRAVAVPIYLAQLKLLVLVDPSLYPTLNSASKAILYLAGCSGVFIILVNVGRGYLRHRRATRPFPAAPKDHRHDRRHTYHGVCILLRQQQSRHGPIRWTLEERRSRHELEAD